MIVRVTSRKDALVYAILVDGSSYFEPVLESQTLNVSGSAKFTISKNQTLMLNVILLTNLSSVAFETYTVGH